MFTCVAHKSLTNLRVFGIKQGGEENYEQVRATIANEISQLRDTLHPAANKTEGGKLFRAYTYTKGGAK